MCRKGVRPLRVATKDNSWFDTEKYSGGKWGSHTRRKELIKAIDAAAPRAYDTLSTGFNPVHDIHPVVKSRRPHRIPFRHRSHLMMYHFLSPEAVDVVFIRTSDALYGITQGGGLYWCREFRPAEGRERARVQLWFALPKLDKSCLTNPMLQNLLDALEDTMRS